MKIPALRKVQELAANQPIADDDVNSTLLIEAINQLNECLNSCNQQLFKVTTELNILKSKVEDGQ